MTRWRFVMRPFAQSRPPVAAVAFYRTRPRCRHIRRIGRFSPRVRRPMGRYMQHPPSFQVRGTVPAMSNAERQRQFRQRNPGYYGRLHAKRRAAVRALAAARAAAATPARAEPLMLPAPAELLIIPGVNAIPASLDAMPAHPALLASQYDARNQRSLNHHHV